MFDTYGELLGEVQAWLTRRHPRRAGDSDFVHRRAVRAKALDALRGLLPAGSLSNLGIYGTGQSYEMLLLRMRSHPLPEARSYAGHDARRAAKGHPVVPPAGRPARTGRGVVGVPEQVPGRHRSHGGAPLSRLAEPTAGGAGPTGAPSVDLVDFDPDGEEKVIAAICYPHTSASESEILRRVRRLGADDRRSLVLGYVGDRSNRRHRPGRAFERTSYRFDVVTDYGAFRDLQRHRMLTIEWQPLGPSLGYDVPDVVDEAGVAGRYIASLERSRELHEALAPEFPVESAYAVALAYRIRYSMQMNARSAMHVVELRSSPQGHPAYRWVAQEMHRLIGERAGHRLLAEAMSHVDYGEPELERLESERRAETRRTAGRIPSPP